VVTQVIVLNGGSSSGKTGIARCLQAILPQPWIRLGVDDLLEALPPSLLDSASGVAFGRATGMAASQAEAVHERVGYDIEGRHQPYRAGGLRPRHRVARRLRRSAPLCSFGSR
jgi:chloramphenicol 3-O-phosphotransferase